MKKIRPAPALVPLAAPIPTPSILAEAPPAVPEPGDTLYDVSSMRLLTVVYVCLQNWIILLLHVKLSASLVTHIRGDFNMFILSFQ